MCGGFVGNLIQRPVTTLKNAGSKAEDLVRPAIKAPVTMAEQYAKAAKAAAKGDIGGAASGFMGGTLEPYKALAETARQVGDATGTSRVTDPVANLSDRIMDTLGARSTKEAAPLVQEAAPADGPQKPDAQSQAAQTAYAWRTKRRRALSSMLFEPASALGVLRTAGGGRTLLGG